MTCRIFDKENILNEIVVTRNGEEALDYLFGRTDETPPGTLPIMIVLDLNLPGIQGGEVLKRIREDIRTAKVPVIVFTSSDKDIDRTESLDSGATDFVEKSVNHRKFAESVRKMIAGWLDVKDEPN